MKNNKKITSCEICNIKFTKKNKLHIHHIDSNRSNDYFRNLINLCENCHKYIHFGKYKKEYNQKITLKLNSYRKIVNYFEGIENYNDQRFGMEILKKLKILSDKYPSQKFCQIIFNFAGISERKSFFYKSNREILINLLLSIEFKHFRYKD